MNTLRLPYDAVLFDLDGTLVATERYWPEAAARGAARAFSELGLSRPAPSTADWMGMVGYGLQASFERLFPDLRAAQRELVLRRCLEVEHELLAQGRAALLPGVRETLEALHAEGLRLGIASNCSQVYLDSMTRELGLERWIEEFRCLDSPRVEDKADMIADLLLSFDTRSAVMVGDRLGDRDAAWANGLPHVHLTGGYAPEGEGVRCEANIEGMSELIPALQDRARCIADLLAELALPGVPWRVGVSGDPCSGKTLLARDLARAAGARCVALEDFRVAPDSSAARDPLEAFDTQRLLRELLQPHAARKDVRLESGGRVIEIPAGISLVLEGPWLLHEQFRGHLERVIHLSLPEPLGLRRAMGRARSLGGLAAVELLRETRIPLSRAFERRFPAAEHASWLLDGSNPLHPGSLGPRAGDPSGGVSRYPDPGSGPVP